MKRLTQSQEVERYARPLVYMMTGGLEYLVDEAGGVCLGVSIRSHTGDSLLVIRAEFEEVRMVAFVGSATAAGAVVKAEKQLRNGGLEWRADKYAK